MSDNLKAAVTKACRYEPELNATYQEFSAHYGTIIIHASTDAHIPWCPPQRFPEESSHNEPCHCGIRFITVLLTVVSGTRTWSLMASKVMEKWIDSLRQYCDYYLVAILVNY